VIGHIWGYGHCCILLTRGLARVGPAGRAAPGLDTGGAVTHHTATRGHPPRLPICTAQRRRSAIETLGAGVLIKHILAVRARYTEAGGGGAG
jgi:hypothetical protein